VDLDLPLHADAVLTPAPGWTSAVLQGSDGLEDGFRFVERAECAGVPVNAVLRADGVSGLVRPAVPHVWWRVMAPGPPGHPSRAFHLVRCRAASGSIASVWSWHDGAAGAEWEGDALRVMLADGTRELHRMDRDRWTVTGPAAAPRASRVFGGARHAVSSSDVNARASLPRPPVVDVPRLDHAPASVGDLTRLAGQTGSGVPARFHLGRDSYRRSEPTWKEAGAPEALVALAATDDSLLVEVTVKKGTPAFAPSGATNELDNEHPDINSDGLQIHARGEGVDGRVVRYSWILVPDGAVVRVTARERDGDPLTVDAGWRETRTGYQVLARIPRAAFGGRAARASSVDVIVNEIGGGRERRRGQLVLSGGAGDWIYLRGDRQDPERYLPFRVTDA
jgi:hypothetical protein